jgi:hypothetical protein
MKFFPAHIAMMMMMMMMLPILSNAAAAAATPASSPAKLWATDLPAFLNDRPGDWIVGHSTDPALSAAEAESFARRDAAGPLFDKLRSRLPRQSWSALLTRIEATLASGDWVADRQVVAVERPYGTIWSAAVLIDASQQRRDRLVREVERETRQQRERAVAGTAGATMIAMVVGSGYLFLNWLTRGFFRGRLLTVSALLITTGIFGIVLLL